MFPLRKVPNIPKVEMTAFETYYSELYSAPEQNSSRRQSNARYEDDDEWYNAYISNEEVLLSLGKMKRKKAVGPDRIAIEIVKQHDVLVPIVTRLFNEAFNTGTIPQEWRNALVRPLFKGKGHPKTRATTDVSAWHHTSTRRSRALFVTVCSKNAFSRSPRTSTASYRTDLAKKQSKR